MGAFSEVLAFDLERHRKLVVPALRAWLERGSLTGELEALYEARYRQLRQSESQHAAFYRSHPRWSEQMQELRSGLGQELARACTCLDGELGARHQDLAGLARIRPTLYGGCESEACADLGLCPFNRRCLSQISAEWVMTLFQELVRTSCLTEPAPLGLGRQFQFYELGWWYGNEVGRDDEAATDFFLASKDPLALLLARLCKRAGIWGWADGGFGEGLLGWLDAAEALQLASGLEAYELSETGPVPAELDSDRADSLLHMRASLAGLRDFAANCGHQGLGILLQRA